MVVTEGRVAALALELGGGRADLGLGHLLPGRRPSAAAVVTQDLDPHPQIGTSVYQPSSDTALRTGEAAEAWGGYEACPESHSL